MSRAKEYVKRRVNGTPWKELTPDFNPTKANGASSRAIAKIRKEAVEKEFLLKNASAASSPREAHYPKSFIVKKEQC